MQGIVRTAFSSRRDCPKARAQSARDPLCTDAPYGVPSRTGGVYCPLPHIRRPCEILMKSIRQVCGERLRSLQSFGGCCAANASGIRGESATDRKPAGPISFRLHRVTVLSEEEGNRHLPSCRVPHRARPYKADPWQGCALTLGQPQREEKAARTIPYPRPLNSRTGSHKAWHRTLVGR